MRHPYRTSIAALALLAAATVAVSRGRPSDTPASAAGSAPGTEKVALRLGYFPNVTHAPAIAGVEKGILADSLGAGVELKTATFNAGPAAVEALFSEALDATFIGPNPAINAYSKSNGEAIRIVAGATSGGAALVVDPTIATAADLKGKKVATPQLGNTQDVALRAWLLAQGLETNLQGGGDVSVLPQENAQTLETFRSGQIAGAWVPEPWATRLVEEAGGKVLVDERTLWPAGQFVTTHLIVRTKFLEEHPDVVERLIRGHRAAVDFVNQNAAEARAVVNAGILRITGKAIPENVIAAAWTNMSFTLDPVASSLRKGADDAKAAGLLHPNTKLERIYSLDILNRVLSEHGQMPVKG